MTTSIKYELFILAMITGEIGIKKNSSISLCCGNPSSLGKHSTTGGVRKRQLNKTREMQAKKSCFERKSKFSLLK